MSLRVECESCGADLGTIRADYPSAEGGSVVTFEPGPGCAHVSAAQVDDDRRAVYMGTSPLPVRTRDP